MSLWIRDFPKAKWLGLQLHHPPLPTAVRLQTCLDFVWREKADGWIMDQLGSSWDIWFLPHRCFSEHTATCTTKRDTVVLFCLFYFFGEKRCLDLEGVHLQNFEKTLMAHKVRRKWICLEQSLGFLKSPLDLGDASFKQNSRRNGTSINFTRVKVDGSFIKHQPVKQYLAQSEALRTFREKLPMAETVG